MLYFFLFCLIGCAFGQLVVNEPNENNWGPDSAAAQYLGLPSGASSVVPNIRATFSCLGRRYGYFADVDNNCQIFHVCHPSVTASGEPVIYHFSKFCPKSTRFAQRQLTCLPETDPKLIPCGDSTRLFAAVDSRLANVQIVQQLENIQQLPEIEQRVEQRVEPFVVEEQRRESFPVKGIQSEVRAQPLSNEGIPVKSVARSELLPQPVPQTVAAPLVEQRVEPVVQEVAEPIVQRAEPLVQQVEPIGQRTSLTPIQQQVQTVVNQPIVPQVVDVRNVEPVQQQTLPLTEPVVQRSPVKQNVVSLTNTNALRTAPAVVNKGYVAPALALRNTQPIVPSVVTPIQTPVEITRPVWVESDVNLRRNVPQTQYIAQSRSVVEPLYVPQYVQSYVPVIQTPRVIRPSQYSSPVVSRSSVVAEQRPLVYIPVQSTYHSVPQYLRTNAVPNVVRPAQNPTFARLSNKQ